MFNRLRKYAKSPLIKNTILFLMLPRKYHIDLLETNNMIQEYLFNYENEHVNTKIIKKEGIDLISSNNHIHPFWYAINQLHAWDFILENDYEINEGFIFELHNILSKNLLVRTYSYRKRKVDISKTTYEPPIIITNEIIDSFLNTIDKQDPIEITLFIMKNQMFENTNKRTGMYVLNAFLLKDNKILNLNVNNYQQYLYSIKMYYEQDDDSFFRNFVVENMVELDFDLNKVKNLKEKHKKSTRLTR